MAARRKIDNHRWIVVSISVVLIALVWIVFAQTLGHDFVNYDDDVYVYKNAFVTSGLTLRGIAWAFTHSHAFNWHPLTTMSHMLDCQLFGLKAGGHHFTNVILHSIATLLLFFLLRQMTGELWPSVFVAALFAIHPLRVESVAWIAERKDVLSGIFFMLTLAAYARYAREPTMRRYLTMSILFALGLMSKPMLVTTPFVMLLLDFWPLRRFTQDRHALFQLMREKIPLLVLSALSCVATVLAQWNEINPFKNVSISMRLRNAVVSYLIYIWQTIWPTKLAPFYPFPSTTDLAAWKILVVVIFLVAITAGVFVLRRTRPYLFVGWLWYVGMLVPVLGVFQVGLQAHADRYMYLPSIGLYLLVTWSIVDLTNSWPYRRVLLGTAAAIILVALTCTAWTQTKYWNDSGSLWRHALDVTSDNYVAHNNLGISLRKGDDAIAQFEEAVQLQPDYASAHHNLGRTLLGARKIDNAIEHLQKTLALEPQNAEASSDLGNAFLLRGEARAAANCYERTLKSAPDSTTALNNLAWIFSTADDASLRNGARAIDLSRKAVELSHREIPIFLRTLAAAYAETGQFGNAMAIAKEVALKSNAALAKKLQEDVDLYQANLPLRDASLTKGPSR